MHWFYHTIRHVLDSWGYWAVLLGLLGEDAGLPLPGETLLMFASFLAHKNTGLQLKWIVLAGIGAAVLGDNIGFYLGRRFANGIIRWGRKLLRLDEDDINTARALIRRHGGRTIFFSRFIFGLRTVAGPVAGSLDMEWKRFLKYNILGAATWVTTITFVGYGFADEFETLLRTSKKQAGRLLQGYF